MRFNMFVSPSESLATRRPRHPRAAAPRSTRPRLSFGRSSHPALALATFVLTAAIVSAQPDVGVQAPAVTEYSGVTGAYGIAAGPDGAVWFTERGPGKIGVITTSGTIAEYALPSPQAEPRVITLGPDGALWFTEGTGNKIGRITSTGSITEFSIPSANASALGITTGPDGALWFSESSGSNSKIGRITTAGTITEYALTPDRGPNMIAAGPDGALWFTEYWANRIGRITTTGDVTEFSIPTADAGAFGITAGPDGALWFTETNANKIGRITTAGVITEYAVRTTGAGPTGITAGPDGAIWFTETSANRLGRITVAGVFSEFVLPAASTPNEIAVGPDGALWFAENTKIGRAQLAKSRTGVLSHIAAGGSWVTVITLVNTSAVAVPVTVAFRGDDGTALTLPITTTQQGQSQTTTGSSASATISPNATALISVGAQSGSTVVGWAEVLSSGPVGGFAIFRTTPQSGPASEGTVPLQTQFPSTMTLPYDNTAGFVMGVAIANLSSASASITARVWDEGGNPLGSSTITIAGNGHTSVVLPNQFTLTSGRRGIVRFQSSGTGGLAGLGLRFSALNTFTSVPTMQ